MKKSLTAREKTRIYARFIKIEHTLFSLPIMLAGTWLAARGWPSLKLFLLILLAGLGARTLALALNRLIDMRIDAKNPRTASRELASGALNITDAILVGLLGLVVYLWAAKSINSFCLMWSWLPVLLFVIYPLLKRFTWLCHFGLGLTWAMVPLAGWFAVKPGFEGAWPAYLLALFSFFWLAGFDIIYATLDEHFDRREGLFSIPARFGRATALRISSVTHFLAFIPLVVLYFFYLQGPWAAFMALVTGLLLFAEHMTAENVDLSFFKINALTGFVVFAMILIGLRERF